MLYLHIPFCEKRCGYCAFNTFSDKHGLIRNYTAALTKQLEHKLQEKGGEKLSSVYFGGGTPSLLDISSFEKIFKIIIPHTKSDTEITIEANPSSWNIEKAFSLIDMGANRLSLGLQSLDDEKLRFLSRVHNADSALKAYEVSQKAGFTNISVDFMYDTPFDDKNFLQTEISNFLALQATHISAYSLTIEENTPFEKNGVRTRYDAQAAAMIAKSIEDAGYEHYEVASFGKKRSKHNLGYWEYKPYIGVGAGAVGFDGTSRYYPHETIEEYIDNPFFEQTEKLSQEDIKTEKILLGLRSVVGVELSNLSGRRKEIDMLFSEKLLKKDDKRVYSTDFFLADELAIRLS